MNLESRSRLEIATAALLFSTGGAAIKLTQLSGVQVAAGRSLVAVIAFLMVFPAARQGYRARTLLVATAYAATLTLFVLSTKLTTAANAIFLQSTAPLYVMATAPLLLHERFRRRDLLSASAIVIGLLLILGAQDAGQSSAPNPALGNILGVCSGVSWAATLMGLRWLGRGGSQDAGVAAVTLGNLLTVVACLPFVSGSDGPGLALSDGLVILYLGVFQVAAPYAFLTRGIRAVPAFAAGLIILIEPALSPVWAFVVHGESVSALAIAGGCLILSASIVKSAADRS
ncbi:MAG: EamA family transporter [Myxococcota bacterium]